MVDVKVGQKWLIESTYAPEENGVAEVLSACGCGGEGATRCGWWNLRTANGALTCIDLRSPGSFYKCELVEEKPLLVEGTRLIGTKGMWEGRTGTLVDVLSKESISYGTVRMDDGGPEGRWAFEGPFGILTSWKVIEKTEGQKTFDDWNERSKGLDNHWDGFSYSLVGNVLNIKAWGSAPPCAYLQAFTKKPKRGDVAFWTKCIGMNGPMVLPEQPEKPYYGWSSRAGTYEPPRPTLEEKVEANKNYGPLQNKVELKQRQFYCDTDELLAPLPKLGDWLRKKEENIFRRVDLVQKNSVRCAGPMLLLTRADLEKWEVVSESDARRSVERGVLRVYEEALAEGAPEWLMDGHFRDQKTWRSVLSKRLSALSFSTGHEVEYAKQVVDAMRKDEKFFRSYLPENPKEEKPGARVRWGSSYARRSL
jgi:hypothetical protein